MDYANWCQTVSKCQNCDLSKTRKNVVISDGNPQSCKIMAVGEAPGSDEDTHGIPFVGRSGQQLRKILNDLNLMEITYSYNFHIFQ